MVKIFLKTHPSLASAIINIYTAEGVLTGRKIVINSRRNANSLKRTTSGRRTSCIVKAVADFEAPLVGSMAPDFNATAVFDQEFVDISLSQYKVRLTFMTNNNSIPKDYHRAHSLWRHKHMIPYHIHSPLRCENAAAADPISVSHCNEFFISK